MVLSETVDVTVFVLYVLCACVSVNIADLSKRTGGKELLRLSERGHQFSEQYVA